MSGSSLSVAGHLGRLERSGLSVVEYSKRYGVSPWSLYTLRSRRRKRVDRGAHKSASLVPRDPPLTFTQLTSPSPIAFRSTEIELAFPNGIRATLPRGFDAGDLRKLVSVLSATGAGVSVC